MGFTKKSNQADDNLTKLLKKTFPGRMGLEIKEFEQDERSVPYREYTKEIYDFLSLKSLPSIRTIDKDKISEVMNVEKTLTSFYNKFKKAVLKNDGDNAKYYFIKILQLLEERNILCV